MSLATSCLVANLQIGVAAGSAKEIVAAGAAVRNHFYVNTLDWKASGDRLLPCKNFIPFMAGFVRLKAEFTELHTRRPVENADKFYVRLDIDPVASLPNDLRVDLPESVYSRLVRITETAMKVRVARATEDLWSRLIEPLNHFATKMESGDVFRDATVRNLVEAVELLPRLNFADDAGLTNVLKVVEIMLDKAGPKTLRKDSLARTGIGGTARAILDEIERIRA